MRNHVFLKVSEVKNIMIEIQNLFNSLHLKFNCEKKCNSK